MLAGAADMISRRGLAATSVRELAKHADAPLGSTYHYFPGGKQQLAVEAVRHAGDAVARVLRKNLAAGPAQGLGAFLALWRKVVLDSDFRAGCPVLAVAVEEPSGADTRAIDTAVEGTVAMCRAKRDITPLDRVARRLEAMINTAVGG